MASRYVGREGDTECKMMLYCVGGVNGTVIAGQTGVGGSWSYQFNLPTSITFDQYGNMYVLDSGNNRIQRWWPYSTYGITVASSGSLWNPRGMSFDTSGNLVVADLSNHRAISFPVSCRKHWIPIVAPFST